MKQYMLFSGLYYYPSGGMEDFDCSFDTLEQAKDYVKATHESFAQYWHHVADRDTGKIVWHWAGGDVNHAHI
jgi:hypothetical protein